MTHNSPETAMYAGTRINDTTITGLLYRAVETLLLLLLQFSPSSQICLR